MKKLLLPFLFIAVAFILNAQDAKPTKEQTVEFIVNTIKDYSNINESDRGNVMFVTKREVKEISFKDCFFSIRMRRYEERFVKGTRVDWIKDGFNEELEDLQINLKDIESVVIRNSEITKPYIIFSCFNAAKLISRKYSHNNEKSVGTETNDKVSAYAIYAPSDEKLVKAFNHLRKLCGAPEPIKFD